MNHTRKMIVARRLQLVLATILLSTCHAHAADVRIAFQNGSFLTFSSPTHDNKTTQAFESGWTRADFINKDGKQITLLPNEILSPTGGIIYQNASNIRISPSGRYAALDILRVGALQRTPKTMPEIASRQYCPVLNTRTGCIISMHTGSICGGEWDAHEDIWISGSQNGGNSTATMLHYGDFPVTANKIWNDFHAATISRYSLKESLIENLGITNMLVCDPPNRNTLNAYQAIAEQLRQEGDLADAARVEEEIEAEKNHSTGKQNYGIRFMGSNMRIDFTPLKTANGEGIGAYISNLTNGEKIHVDQYEPEGGSPPEVKSVFVGGRQPKRLFVIVAWSVHHWGAGTVGNLYQIFAYEEKLDQIGGETRLRQNKTLMERFGSGLDGSQEGQLVTYNYKTAGAIRKQLRVWGYK